MGYRRSSNRSPLLTMGKRFSKVSRPAAVLSNCAFDECFLRITPEEKFPRKTPGHEAIISTPANTLMGAQGQFISPHLLLLPVSPVTVPPCWDDSAIRSSA
jgi:hypothetical protein